MKANRFALIGLVLVLVASVLGCGVFGPVLSQRPTSTPYPTFTLLPTNAPATPVPVVNTTSSLGNCSIADIQSQASQNYLNIVNAVMKSMGTAEQNTTSSDMSKMYQPLIDGLPKVQAAYAALSPCVQNLVSKFNTDFVAMANDSAKIEKDITAGDTNAELTDLNAFTNDATNASSDQDALIGLGTGTPQP
jgi:hypothetical protein